MCKGPKKKYDWYKNPVVEDLEEGSYDYIMTQEMVDQFGEAMEDGNPLFPTIAGKHDGPPKSNIYENEEVPGGIINARSMQECFNPPTPGKRLFVTGRIAGRYIWRGYMYEVTEATCVDEDGRLIDRQSSVHRSGAEEMGKLRGEQ